MLSQLVRAYTKKSILLGSDLFLVLLTFPLALFIRLDPYVFPIVFKTVTVQHFAVIFLSYFFSFMVFRAYRTIIRLANLYTALRVCLAVVLGACITYIVGQFIVPLPPLPRSTYFIQMLLLLPACLVSRFSIRIVERFRNRQNTGVHTLVYGAGLTTDRFLPIVLKQKNEIKVFGIIDDDLAKRGSEIQGIKILGGLNDVPRLVKKYSIELIILSIPSVPGERVREITDVLYAQQLQVKVLPAPEAYLNQFNNKQIDIRDLNIEDLLRRAPRNIDRSAIARIIKGKSVLVTGGGGSIGSELVRQIAAMEPENLIVNDASEFALYTITEEIQKKFPYLKYSAHLGSLADTQVCSGLFEKSSFDIIFHACAYKHVPLVEDNISAAILNNVMSAKNVFEFSARKNVGRVVLISSDKAVRPTNVMGATKRVAELLAVWYSANQTNSKQCAFSAVRFGNVLGSSGSVVPKFVEQIKAGGPIQITHPDITRYFMLIPEAVSLVLQAATASTSGEIFVLNMGEPIKITDMAKDLARLMGKRINHDINIEFTGLRPGEKLYEELHLDAENLNAVTSDFYKLDKAIIPASNFIHHIEHLLSYASKNDDRSAKDKLFKLVVEHETELAFLDSAISSTPDFPFLVPN